MIKPHVLNYQQDFELSDHSAIIEHKTIEGFWF